MLYTILLGNLPPLDPPPIMLKRGETARWSEAASLLEERTRQVYVSGSRGVSIRVMRGVSYRVGASRGHRVPVSEIRPVGAGTLAVTNKRIVFVGPKQVSVA